jgi:hypothetical protein
MQWINVAPTVQVESAVSIGCSVASASICVSSEATLRIPVVSPPNRKLPLG